jgi:hypothetical protein
MKKDAVPADSSCIDFLVSILLRFPQIFAIKYNSSARSYVFTFMFRGNLAKEKFLALKGRMADYFTVYGELNQGLNLRLLIKKRKFRQRTFIDIVVDGESLNFQDINLLASTMAVELGENVISDYEGFSHGLLEGDDLDPDREIEYLSRDGIQSRRKDSLIVFRESGKVYVFDK